MELWMDSMAMRQVNSMAVGQNHQSPFELVVSALIVEDFREPLGGRNTDRTKRSEGGWCPWYYGRSKVGRIGI